MNQIIRNEKFQLRAEPPRATFEEERLYRKRRLAASYRIFALKGYDLGLAGHITARDPEFTDRFWVAPLGPWFGHIRVSDLVQVDHGGNILVGEGPINQAGFAIHSEIHKAHPDIISAAHSHSVYGKAWSTLGRLLDPISQDSCFFYDNHVLFDDFTGIVLDTSEGARIAAALGDKRAAILQNHGILTVGKSVESAVASYIALENACETQLLAEAAGTIKPIRPEVARHTSEQMRGVDPGAFGFRPLWERILREQPDFLE
ncbi:class II aldolase/adducin family protein [Beijerinckia indica]|uniref:Class II aldolase/adducin family protein n=1 Tax=Beijerinckia indica subsp. indica (strain ATCC 9039 / DSM 1715 / NCIMB 8712) TaxID=395963 RepID=B2IJF2_BEII9|nr:class II aldolase/adducin family protein [Beijerinckia indica]ACB96265.1 class II aldolase/adducin family protein [Beijerinckia indica subsp. indica ATCC 9039]